MKKIIYSSLLILVFTACSSPKWIAAPYTSVDKMVSVKPGMTIAEVNQTLGIAPYNLYALQEDGATVLMYNYRIKERRLKVPTSIEKREEYIRKEYAQANGEEYYKVEPQSLYVYFRDGKVKSMISGDGLSEGEVLMIVHNSLKYLSKDELTKNDIVKLGNWFVVGDRKDTTILVPFERFVKKEPSVPLLQIKKKKKD